MKPLLRFLFAYLAALPALAADPQPSHERALGSDHFAAGANLSISAPVGGDLFAAGGNVDADAPVDGDAVLAGGNVRVGSSVAQNLYLAGGRLSVNGAVRRNARIAGGHVALGARARIGGNASIAGGDVRIEAPIGGYLQAAGGQVFLDSAVAGDVEVGGGSLELGPNARIGGKLRYASREELKQSAGAQVRGGIERIALPESARRPAEAPGRGAGGFFKWLWSAGFVVLAAVLAASLPAVFGPAAIALRTRWPSALLVGFVAFACVPLAALIGMLTLVGIPLALAAMGLYLALLIAGYAASGASIGVLALQHWRPPGVAHAGWRVLSGALGMLLVSVLAALPWIGGLFAFAALLLGMGLLLQRLKPASPAA